MSLHCLALHNNQWCTILQLVGIMLIYACRSNLPLSLLPLFVIIYKSHDWHHVCVLDQFTSCFEHSMKRRDSIYHDSQRVIVMSSKTISVCGRLLHCFMVAWQPALSHSMLVLLSSLCTTDIQPWELINSRHSIGQVLKPHLKHTVR